MSIYLSASSIKDFIDCPQKVLYRRTKPFPEVRSKGMIVGEIAHRAIEKGWEKRDLAYAIVKEECRKAGLARADQTNLEFYMDMFFYNFKDLLSNKDLIEYNFKIQIFDDIYIVGKIDRISSGNLYDWKTGGKIASRLSSDVQCIIYEWAYKKIFSKEPASICIASLAKGELIPYQRDDFYIQELFGKIIPRMIKTVKNETYERLGMFNHSCFNCPYRVGCLGRGGREEEYELDSSISPE